MCGGAKLLDPLGLDPVANAVGQAIDKSLEAASNGNIAGAVQAVDPLGGKILENTPEYQQATAAIEAGNWLDPYGSEQSAWDVLGAGPGAQITSGGQPILGQLDPNEPGDRDIGRTIGTMVAAYFTAGALAGEGGAAGGGSASAVGGVEGAASQAGLTAYESAVASGASQSAALAAADQAISGYAAQVAATNPELVLPAAGGTGGTGAAAADEALGSGLKVSAGGATGLSPGAAGAQGLTISPEAGAAFDAGINLPFAQNIGALYQLSSDLATGAPVEAAPASAPLPKAAAPAAPVSEFGDFGAAPAQGTTAGGAAAGIGELYDSLTGAINTPLGAAAATGLLGAASQDTSAEEEAARAAAVARAAEDARAAAVARNVDFINSQFGQFDDDYYRGIADAYETYYNPQLTQQAQSARRRLRLNPAGGSTASSAYGRNISELERDILNQQTGISDKGLNAANDLRQNVEANRSSLLASANAGEDFNSLATRTSSNLKALTAPPAYSPIGDLFARYTGAAANARLAADSGYGPVNPLLFGRSSRKPAERTIA